MTKKLWGGRFTKPTDALVEEFTGSIQYDYKLALYDVAGSLKHVEILRAAGYLSKHEAKKLKIALQEIYRTIVNGRFAADGASEDIHTQIQNLIQHKTGELALKLQTARSRNDQVAYATKMYCLENLAGVQAAIRLCLGAFEDMSKKYARLVIPGFTHMQHAQPVYLKDYFGAFTAMLKRDEERLSFIAKRIIPSMGAGALAGTPIDAADYASCVAVTDNSLDAVSDRDFVIETVAALSIVAMHVSRLAEDLIIWSTKEYDFVEIDDAYCTGSSLMPQKKNPDALELMRGFAGRLCGNLTAVLTMMKGLPLTYNRDMQLDKEPLFNSFEIVSSELTVLTGLIKTLKFNEYKIKEQLKDESLYATDIVYYLVDRKVPFKTAHTIVGNLVKYSLDNDILIKDMPENVLKNFSGTFVKKEIVKLFDPLVSVRSKKSIRR